MNHQFDRISWDRQILGGKPCIQGTRISVEFILDLIAGGADSASIYAQFPQLQPGDIEQALLYAARFQRNEVADSQSPRI